MTLSDETCESVRDAFGALLSGEATRDEVRRANRHLAACAACREEFAGLAAFRGRLRERYGAATPARSWRAIASLTGLALAASLVVGLAVTRSTEETTVAASPAAPVVAAVDQAEDDVDIWIDLMSDEEIQDLLLAANEP